MRRCVSALFLGFILLSGNLAFAQGEARVLNLEVEGSAKIIQNDVVGARDGAIQDALQKAILEAASIILSPTVKNEKYVTARKTITEQPAKYINNYKITAENQKVETYHVTVNTTVAWMDLKSDLARMGFVEIAGQDKANSIVFLEVNGLKKYADFLYLKESLKKQIKNVKYVSQQSFEWQHTHLELEISGTAQALANELIKTGRYILTTKQINKNRIEVNLLQRGGE